MSNLTKKLISGQKFNKIKFNEIYKIYGNLLINIKICVNLVGNNLIRGNMVRNIQIWVNLVRNI